MDPFSECGSHNQGGQGGGDGQCPRPEGCLSCWTHRRPAKVSPCSQSRHSHPHHARLPGQRRNRTVRADAQRPRLASSSQRTGAALGSWLPVLRRTGLGREHAGRVGPHGAPRLPLSCPPALPGLALLGSRAASVTRPGSWLTAEAQEKVSWHRAGAWRPDDPSPLASREWSGVRSRRSEAGGRDGISSPCASSICSHRTREGMQGPATGDADPGMPGPDHTGSFLSGAGARGGDVFNQSVCRLETRGCPGRPSGERRGPLLCSDMCFHVETGTK